MKLESLVKLWFEIWANGNYLDLPISENFQHISPFGKIDGKDAYIELIKANEDKFLGQNFNIHDAIYENDRACVRYTATQGKNFSLDVSEWYYVKDSLIEQIIAYYHIGEIREERKIKNYE